MKEKSVRNKQKEQNWAKTALAFENDSGLNIMENSTILSAIKKRKLLGPSKTKQISIRIPEEDLIAFKEIAQTHERKYQQILVYALENFLDQYQEKLSNL